MKTPEMSPSSKRSGLPEENQRVGRIINVLPKQWTSRWRGGDGLTVPGGGQTRRPGAVVRSGTMPVSGSADREQELGGADAGSSGLGGLGRGGGVRGGFFGTARGRRVEIGSASSGCCSRCSRSDGRPVSRGRDRPAVPAGLPDGGIAGTNGRNTRGCWRPRSRGDILATGSGRVWCRAGVVRARDEGRGVVERRAVRRWWALHLAAQVAAVGGV